IRYQVGGGGYDVRLSIPKSRHMTSPSSNFAPDRAHVPGVSYDSHWTVRLASGKRPISLRSSLDLPVRHVVAPDALEPERHERAAAERRHPGRVLAEHRVAGVLHEELKPTWPGCVRVHLER